MIHPFFEETYCNGEKTVLPRRIQLQKCTPAELSIYTAINEVEKLGADVRLTKALNLLDEARELVADVVDKVQECDASKAQ